MANRFLNNIRINDEYTLPSTDGDANQIIQTDGAGNLSFVDLSAVEGAQSNLVYFDVKNSSGSTINKGKGVMAVGTDGNSGHILIDEMIADGSVEPKYFLGVLETTVANGGFARVISFGEIDQFNTNGQNGEDWDDGNILWCDPDSPGDFTKTEPDGPNVKIAAAIVLNAATNGKIQVRVQANEGIHDLHDTKIQSQVDGDVLVWDNTTGVWFNDSTLNVDYANGKVGIGTTSPQQNLHIESTDPTLVLAQSGNLNQAASGRILFAESPAYTTNNAHFEIAYNGSTNRLQFNSPIDGTTNLMNVGRDGNVGINVTNPNSLLEIAQKTDGVGIRIFGWDDRSNEYLFIYDNGSSGTYGASGNVKMQAGGGGYVFLDSESHIYLDVGNASSDFLFRDGGGNTLVKIEGDGNVGIGITNPGAKLHVIGSSTSTDLAMRIANNVNTQLLQVRNDGFVAINHSNFDYTLDVQKFANENDDTIINIRSNWANTSANKKIGSLFFTAYDVDVDSGATKTAGGIRVLAENEWTSAANANAYMTFNTLGGGLFEERMRIDSDGYVGIGTPSPNEKLEVSEGYILSSGASTGHGFELQRTGSDTYQLRHLDGGLTVFNSTDSRKEMTFDGAGNVGIGTPSPGAKLDVNGNVALNYTGGASASNYISMVGSRASFGYDGSIGSAFMKSSDTSKPLVFGSGTNELMRIVSSTGNVGIGETNPGYRLTVASDLGTGGTLAEFRNSNLTYSQNLYLSFNSSKDVTWSQGSSSGGSIFSTGTRGFSFQINTVDKVKIDSAGQFKLLDYGSGTFTGTATQRLAVDSSGNVIEIPIGSGPVDGSGTANYITKWSDADTITDSLLYDDGTQVLIGATSSAFSDGLYLHNTTAYAVSGWRVGTTTTYVGKLVNNAGVLSLEADGLRSIGFRNTTNGDIVRIDGVNSRVGIGTTNPQRKLDVVDDNPIVRIADSNSTIRYSALQLQTDGGSWYFSSGDSNTGAGVANSDLWITRNNGGTDNRFRFHRDQYAFSLYYDGNQNVVLNANGDTFFNGGDVGIGTTSPQAALQVASTSNDFVAKFSHTTATGYAPGSILLQAGQGDSRGQGLYHYNTEADESWFTGVPYNVGSRKWIVANKPDTTFNTDVAQLSYALLTIDSDNGNVGIGTTSPGAKLEVAGTLKATGEVTLSNYSDGGLSVNSSGVVRVEPSYQNISLGESYAANLREYYYRNGYTVSPTDTGYQYAKLIDQGILNKASLVIMPQAQKEGLLAVNKPNGTDFTFTRASAATRVNSEGLIEKETQNLLLQSNDFSSGSWNYRSGDSSTGGQTGYDGSSDAWLLNVNTGGWSVYQNYVTTGVYNFSLYVKKGTIDVVQIDLFSSSVLYSGEFNLTSGTDVGGGNTIDRTITDVGGGWYRVSISADVSSTLYARIGAVGQTGNFYIQDAQLNQGLVADSYLETTTTAVYGGITDNIPRLDYTDASCPSLLVETQRTNLVPYSEYFESYSQTRVAFVYNAAISPEGVENAAEFNDTATSGTHFVKLASGVVGGGVMSFFAKQNTHRYVMAGPSSSINKRVYFDLQDGVMATIGNDAESYYGIEDYGNGWYRCYVAFGDLESPSIFTASGDGSSSAHNNYLGDGSGVYIYGAQVEQNVNYHTSYIPTYGASVTRVSDSCRNFTFNDLRTTDASIFVEFNHTTGKTGAFRFVFGTENSTTNVFDSIQLNSSSSGTLFSFAGISGVSFSYLSLLSGTNKALIKFERSSGAVKTFLNGTEIDSGTASSIPEIHKISLGARINPYSGFATDRQLGDTIKQFLAFPTALTDSECIALTTL